LGRLERLERLKRWERWERLERLKIITNLSNLKFKSNYLFLSKVRSFINKNTFNNKDSQTKNRF